MKSIIKIIIYCILFLIISQTALAIGISPSKTIIDFQPGLEKTYTFNIINWENPTEVEVYTSGILAEHITLSETKFHLNANEIKSFTIKVNLPYEIKEPGLHDTRVGVVEISVGEEEEGTVGAVTGVESQFLVLVPYPGKYISAKLKVDDTNINKETEFIIDVHNLGQLDLNKVNAEISVFDANETKITQFSTNTISIASKQKKSLYGYWTPENISAGIYKAKAIINYDDKTSEAEKIFRIGDLLIEIINIFPGDLRKGEINKIGINLKSLWNEIIPGVYAEVYILDEKKELLKVKSEIIDIKPRVEETIYAYLDLQDIPTGDYVLKTVLYFEKKTVEKQIKISIKKDNTLIYIIFISGVILLGSIIIVYLFLRRRYKKK